MAVDTRNKRASVLGFALAALAILPAPDGAITAPDRAQLAYSYPGISIAPPIPIPDVTRMVDVLVTPLAALVDVRVTAATALIDIEVRPGSAFVDIVVT